MDSPPSRTPRAQLRAARRPHGHRASSARCASSAPRFVLPFAEQRARRARPCSAATRRWCWRSASAWATPPRRSPPRSPQRNFLGVEVHPPGVGALLRRIGATQLHNVRIVQHDAVEVLRAHDRARLAGRRARVLSRPVAQEAAPQAAADPAAVRGAAGVAPGARRPPASAPPTGQPYAQQMLEVLAAEPALANTAEGYAPRPAYRPLTKFEQRGLKLGHGGVGPGVSPQAPLHRRRLARLSRPTDPAAPGGGQHDDAEDDAVPGERHEVVGGDVADQPAHAGTARRRTTNTLPTANTGRSPADSSARSLHRL